MFRDAPPEVETLKPLREWRPHGVVGLLFRREVADALVNLKIPLVNTTSMLSLWHVPLVEAGHESVGRMVAEYFPDKDYRNFGFFGRKWTHVSRTREAGHRARLQVALLGVDNDELECGLTWPSVSSIGIARPTDRL